MKRCLVQLNLAKIDVVLPAPTGLRLSASNLHIFVQQLVYLPNACSVGAIKDKKRMYHSILNLQVFSQPLSIAVSAISLSIRPIRHSHSIQSPERSVSVLKGFVWGEFSLFSFWGRFLDFSLSCFEAYSCPWPPVAWETREASAVVAPASTLPGPFSKYQ